MATVLTLRGGRFAPKVQVCSFGQGVAAQDIKIELDRVVHIAAQLTDDQIDALDPPGVVRLGSIEHHGQNSLRYREFMHR
jgi:hypothetical protein